MDLLKKLEKKFSIEEKPVEPETDPEPAIDSDPLAEVATICDRCGDSEFWIDRAGQRQRCWNCWPPSNSILVESRFFFAESGAKYLILDDGDRWLLDDSKKDA